MLPLNGFQVTLFDDHGKVVDQAQTDAYGRYRFPRKPRGKYKIVWKHPDLVPAGTGDGVTGDGEASRTVPGHQVIPVDVEDETYHVEPIVVRSQPRDEVVAIYGRLQMRDGSSPMFSDAGLGIEQKVEVRITEQDAEIAKTPSNAFGEFVATGLPREELTVHAQLVQRRDSDATPRWEAVPGQELAKIVSRSDFPHDGLFRAKLKFPNSPPRLTRIDVTDCEGKVVPSPCPGQTVLCTAKVRDVDGADKIECLWRVGGEQGYSTANPFQWKLSDIQGRQTSYLVITDGKGGFATERVSLPVATIQTTSFDAPE